MIIDVELEVKEGGRLYYTFN